MAASSSTGVLAKEWLLPTAQEGPPHSQVVATTSHGPATTVWLAGITCGQNSPSLDSGSITEQTEATVDGIEAALAKAGATLADVAITKTYIVGLGEDQTMADQVARVWESRTQQVPKEKRSANSVVGVTRLAHPKMLAEIGGYCLLQRPRDPQQGAA